MPRSGGAVHNGQVMAAPVPTPNEPPVVRLAIRIAAVCILVSILTLVFRGGGDGAEETSLTPSPTSTTSTTEVSSDTTLYPEFPALPEGSGEATFDTIPPPPGERAGTTGTTARPAGGGAGGGSGTGSTSRPTSATTSRPPATSAPKPAPTTTAAPSGSGSAGAASATREGTLNGRTYRITGVYAYRSGDPACGGLCATAQVDATDGTGVGSDVTATTTWVDRAGTITQFGQTEWQTSWNPPRAAGRNGPNTAAGTTVAIIVRLQSTNGQVIHLRSDPTTVQQL